jgi:hypothetical protein
VRALPDAVRRMHRGPPTYQTPPDRSCETSPSVAATSVTSVTAVFQRPMVPVYNASCETLCFSTLDKHGASDFAAETDS